ncbi:MAG: DUF6384 family protein [Planctomycetaceae bacterium]
MSNSVSTAADLSLSEMLHVLDVARTLRRDSEVVASELNKEVLYASLKQRLLASAAAAGDNVTEAEVDAAIRIYFENLHRYEDPPLSFSMLLAHAYIRRTWITAGLLFCGLVTGSLWWLFWRAEAPLASQTRAKAASARSVKAFAESDQQLQKQLTSARSIANDPAAATALDQLDKEAAAARANQDAAALGQITAAAAALEAQLREDYEVVIVSDSRRRSGVEQGYGDKLSGYYLIVEARTPTGDILPRRITSREDGQTREVRSWGEQVPKAVYDRIARDKQSDGVVDEQPFAIKRRGQLHEQVMLPGTSGQPLQREGQITSWKE